ncbi:hypothetical protein QQ045_020303 [Rhodiola kirilowii]
MAAHNLLGLTRSIVHCFKLQNLVSQNSAFALTEPSDTLQFVARFRHTPLSRLSTDYTQAPIDRHHRCSQPAYNNGKRESRWSSRAIRAYAMSELEARKIRKPNTWTEALLMEILVEGKHYR